MDTNSDENRSDSEEEHVQEQGTESTGTNTTSPHETNQDTGSQTEEVASTSNAEKNSQGVTIDRQGLKRKSEASLSTVADRPKIARMGFPFVLSDSSLMREGMYMNTRSGDLRRAVLVRPLSATWQRIIRTHEVNPPNLPPGNNLPTTEEEEDDSGDESDLQEFGNEAAHNNNVNPHNAPAGNNPTTDEEEEDGEEFDWLEDLLDEDAAHNQNVNPPAPNAPAGNNPPIPEDEFDFDFEEFFDGAANVEGNVNGVGNPNQNGVGNPNQNGVGNPNQNGVGNPNQNGVGNQNVHLSMDAFDLGLAAAMAQDLFNIFMPNNPMNPLENLQNRGPQQNARPAGVRFIAPNQPGNARASLSPRVVVNRRHVRGIARIIHQTLRSAFGGVGGRRRHGRGGISRHPPR